MSNWKHYNMTEKIIEILSDISDNDPGHHLSPPFLTAYQIAIEFNRRHKSIVNELEYEVGGKGTGRHVSLSQYIARSLSSIVKSDPQGPIKGGFLSSDNVHEISYSNDDNLVVSSLTDARLPLSIFRL